MSNKSKKKSSSSDNVKENDVYVDETIVKLEPDVDKTQVEEYEDDNKSQIKTKIDEVVKEYNGDPKEESVDGNDLMQNHKAEKSKLKKIDKKRVILTISIVFAFVIAFIIICVVNKINSNIYNNIFVAGKNVTGMTSTDFSEYLKKEQENLNASSLKIIQDNEEILEIVPSDIVLEVDTASMEKKVFGYGRNSNILKNNFDIIYALICKKEFDLDYKYDVNKLSEIVKEIKESLNDKVVQDSYVVDENTYTLIITRGKSGNTIEENVVKEKIIEYLSNGIGEYTLDIVTGKPDDLDIDVVYSKVKREATDAYIDKTSTVYKFIQHQVGIDFDKEELKTLLNEEENKEEGKVIEYKLTVTEPKIKMSDIEWDMYEYKISSFTTYFATTDQNRVNNLRVALNLLNGKVIMPGETFSYNSVVGGATTAQGFKPAATFVGGRITSEVGGGICQTVSTLYNTALLANLEIVQRKAHSLPVAYVPASRDATVYYPSIDFKFKNTRAYPIKIVTSFNSGGNLTIALYGTKEENEYDISITSKKTSIISFTTQYANDSSMDKGTKKVVQSGSEGYTSEAYITKKLNGKVVSTTLLSKDTYKAVNQIVNVGTKEVQVQEPVTTTPTSEGNTSSTTTTTNAEP